MMRRVGPRTGSVVHRLLIALAAAPQGRLSDRELLPLLSPDNRTCWRLTQYAEQLALWDMAIRLPGGVQIMPAGRAFFASKVYVAAVSPVPQKPAGLMAQPRTVPVFKPLDIVKMMRGRPQRPGMDAWREVPSLICSSRVFAGGAQ